MKNTVTYEDPDDIRCSLTARRLARLLVEGRVEKIYATYKTNAEAMVEYLSQEYDADAYIEQNNSGGFEVHLTNGHLIYEGE